MIFFLVTSGLGAGFVYIPRIGFGFVRGNRTITITITMSVRYILVKIEENGIDCGFGGVH